MRFKQWFYETLDPTQPQNTVANQQMTQNTVNQALQDPEAQQLVTTSKGDPKLVQQNAMKIAQNTMKKKPANVGPNQSPVTPIDVANGMLSNLKVPTIGATPGFVHMKKQ